MERWIAARPWESRLPYQSVSPNKSQKKAGGNKVAKNTNSATRVSNSVKPSASNGKGAANKKISESSDEKPANQEPNPKPVILRPKAKNGTMMQDQQLQPQASDNAG